MVATMESKAAQAYIWDLDGTLLDSYGVIVPSVLAACCSFGFTVEEAEAHRQVIRHSVTFYLQTVAESRGLPFEALMGRYSEISAQHKDEIRPMPHALESLEGLRQRGARHFVYTHRGKTTRDVLERLGLLGCFTEIVTSLNGFARKPEPDAILYLLQRHGLDPEATFYVGDRTIDMDCAKNAGIRGILFLPEGSPCVPNGAESVVVRDLREIGALA